MVWGNLNGIRLLVFSVVLVLGAACGGNRDHVGNRGLLNSPLIITNADSVLPGDPISLSTVKLSIGYKNFDDAAMCSGTLIDDRIVVTAAHCVDNTPWSVRISFYSDSTTMVTEKRAVLYSVHHGWRGGEGNDIALVLFEGDVPEGFKPAGILRDGSVLGPAFPVTISGFGRISGEVDSASGSLLQAGLTVDTRLDGGLVEIYDPTQKVSACYGDSGGPAFANIGDQWLLWGVAHGVRGTECEGNSYYTDISFHLSWIDGTIMRLKQEHIALDEPLRKIF